MGEPEVRMDVRQAGGSVAVVDIKGDVTAACEPVLMSAYEEASSGGAARVLLNFTGLEYMNSGGIGMLVTLLVRAGRQRQQLAACAGRGPIQHPPGGGGGPARPGTVRRP